MKKFILLIVLVLNMQALDKLPDEAALKKQIGRMLIVGFENQSIDKNSQIVKDIQKYELGGVILFDRFYKDRTKVKNIANPNQLKALTSNLQKFSSKPLLISIDQEGGKVQRLKPKYGFINTPSAKDIASMSEKSAKKYYSSLAKQLKDIGINLNFAPVVDLSLNKENRVIYQLNRSYGSDAKEVAKYAQLFMSELEKESVFSVLKHFPGHGSSLGDSHEGFVDITNTWSKKELEPYKTLIESKSVKMIMTAHVFNKNLDDKYPATLSYSVNTKLLREELNYKGLIISDDLQMKAISKHYNLKDVVSLAINSGVDILLFGNQLDSYKVEDIVNSIYAEVVSGAISYKRIQESNQRLDSIFY